MAATVDDLLRDARRRLAASPLAPSSREALLLMARILGLSEAQVLARGEQQPSRQALARFRQLLDRRLGGEPMAYLLGEREFYGRRFKVDRRVLIPRPETEHLVEAALGLRLPARPRILDVGTGSGCLAVTLALEIPQSRVIAADLSPAALALALDNARALGAAQRVHGLCMDLVDGLRLDAFDLVVSNPPYIALGEKNALSREILEHEPWLALFGGESGLDVLDRLLAAAGGLRSGSALLLEIGAGQLTAVKDAAAAHDLEVQRVVEDYAGIPRTMVIRRRP